MSNPRIIIIGAGPCGLGAAHRLQELGYDNYVIYEKNSQVGGLAASSTDDAGFVWDFGVHVAHSHYHYFDRLMESLLPNGFYYHERRSWVRVCGSWVPYPFQYNIRHLPDGPRAECLAGLEDVCKTPRDPPSDESFDDWIRRTSGRGIAKYFMLPYNRKIWAIDLKCMGVQWMGDRVPPIDVDRVRRNVFEARDDVSWGPNHVFAYPKQGGTGALWNALANKLPGGTLRTNEEIIQIDPVRRRITLSSGEHDYYDYLISSMPIPDLILRAGLHELAGAAEALRHTHVYVTGVAVNTAIPAELVDKTWIYCPEEGASFFRVTPFSGFSPAHVPDVSCWCSLLCETSTDGRSSMVPPEKFNGLAVDGLDKVGIISCGGRGVHYHPMTAEYGYPVPTRDRDKHLKEIIKSLETKRIFSRGRFGGWKYEVGNMDHSVMQGVEAVDRLLLGTQEKTWESPNVVNSVKQ
ncbi:MAG: NAD(P)/FAD-dependent oxidoreductase [Kiritimatiellia bacterium]